MPAVRINAYDVAFDVVDEGAGTPVVLLHDFLLDKESWDAQAAELSKRVRVLRFDLRGMGTSPATPGPYLMSMLAGDLAATLDALSISQAALVGHALGGYVALAFCRMFSERVSSLTLLCSDTGADGAAIARERYDLADKIERDGLGVIAADYARALFAPASVAANPLLVERARASIEGGDARGAAAMLRGIAERDSSEDILADIDIPILAVAGRHDVLVDAASVSLVSERARRARLVTLECGHLPQWEVPGPLGELLNDFLVSQKRMSAYP